MSLTSAQKNALNNISPALRSLGFYLGNELEIVLADIASGNLGIEADAADVDSLALGGGFFSQDSDTTSGLTFGYGAGRINLGRTVLSVAAGTIALSSSTTNYVEVNRAGVVSKNTSGFTPGRLPLYTIATGGSAITTVTSAKPLAVLLGDDSIIGLLLTEHGRTKELDRSFGDVTATTSKKIIAPAGVTTLTRVAIAVSTTHATNDTDYWTFSLVNKGPAGSGTTAMLAATDPNTTKTTGGSGITANVTRLLTLHGTAANLDVAAGDVLIFTATKSGSAVDLDELELALDFSFED